MTVTAAYGYTRQLGIDTTNPVAKRFNFSECTVGKRGKLEDMNRLRGTLDPSQEVVRNATYSVEGQINTIPTATELTYLLPWMLGTPASGTTYALAQTLATRYVSTDESNNLDGGTDGKVFTSSGCAVDKWTIKASEGGLALDLTLDVVGLTIATGLYNTFPSLSIEILTKPWLFTDMGSGLSIGGSFFNIQDIEISSDVKIDKSRYFQSRTLTGTYPTERAITVKTSIPWAGAEALYDAGDTPAAMIATWTNGVYVLTATMPAVMYPCEKPQARGRQETMFGIQGRAYKTGSTSPITFTLAVS